MKNEKLPPGAGVVKGHNSRLIFKNRINALIRRSLLNMPYIV
jgi:hypothetical protein